MSGGGAEVIEREGWRFYPSWANADDGALEPLIAIALAAANGRCGPLIRRSQRATTYRANIPPNAAGEFIVKVLDRPRGADALKQIWRGPRAAHVARVTAQLNAAGFGAPAVLIHGVERDGGRELIVMERAAGDGPFRALEAVARAPAHKQALMRALGAEIARMHRAGFVHGDLTPYNMFVVRGEPPGFVFVDHERTRRSFFIGRYRRQLRNLVQLGRFDLPGVSRSDRMRALHAYASELGWQNGRSFQYGRSWQHGRSWRALRRRVAAMIGRRLARDRFESAGSSRGGE